MTATSTNMLSTILRPFCNNNRPATQRKRRFPPARTLTRSSPTLRAPSDFLKTKRRSYKILPCAIVESIPDKITIFTRLNRCHLSQTRPWARWTQWERSTSLATIETSLRELSRFICLNQTSSLPLTKALTKNSKMIGTTGSQRTIVL